MARYDTYTQFDDRMLEDLDMGFVGFNNRLRPDQLPKGFLADSKNGRMDQNGEWQTRKGMDNVIAPLSAGGTALSLPFLTVGTTDNDTNGITAAHGSCATAVIDSVRRLQVTIDVDGQTSRDFAVTGATDSDNVADFTNTLTGLSNSFTDGIHSCRVASIATATISDTSSASRDGSTTTVKVQYDGVNLTSTHGLTVGANVTIANATYSGTGGAAAVNTVQTITAISTTGSTANDTLSFTVDGLDAAVSGTGVTTTFNNTVTLTITDYVCGNDTFSGGSVVVKTPSINDTAINEIYGSCIFSDPNDDTESYIILAANAKAVAIKVSNPSTNYDLNYPTGETVSSPVNMIQAFNKLFIFRQDGNTAFTKDLSATNINTSPQLDLVDSGEFTQPTQIVCASGEFALIENRGIVHQSDGVSQGDSISVVGDKTLSGDQTSGLVIGERLSVAKVFTAGSTTSITSVAKAAITGGEFDGLYKITATAATHGKNVGDPITIAGFGDIKIDGKRFVAEVNGNDVVFYVPQNPSITLSGDETLALAAGFEFYLDSSKTSTHVTDGESLTSTPVFARAVSIGLGFTHMPAPEYGVYHQRRLAVPYRYNVNDAANSFTDRKIFDEILLSDILDTDTYDQVYGQFRFNAGKSDFNVGMHSFSDDKLIVFNRNSIHIVVGSGSIANASAQLLTDEVGLIARDSVVQVGNQVLFLSDNGVYGMNFIDLYNLRGNDVPLSENINSTIKDIDKANASKATAVYFDNKYYLAVPTKTFSDGSPNSQGINNVLLIYNFLNKSWESIDTVNNVDTSNNTISRFEFSNLLVAGKGLDRGVYVTNTDGGIHKLEVYDDGVDRIITEIGGSQKSVTVEGSATTRMFTLGSIDRKKFNNFELHLQSSEDNASDVSISAVSENIDSEPALNLTPSGTVGNTYGPFKNADGNNQSNIPAGEDVSVRGRIGNKRAYGLQIILNSTLGRPRFRSLKIAGAETFRSTSSVQ